MARWGLAATIKAAAPDILRFAAYHIEAGAHRLHLYLDAPCPAAMPHLETHPKIRVTLCDKAWWARRKQGRPEKHQVRQSLNATHAYRRKPDIEWLVHMDVDEFLVSDMPISDVLANQPEDTRAIRARPMEALGGEGHYFKDFVPPGPDRLITVSRLYPSFGSFVKGGFLSHVAGKVFVRKGLDKVTLRIHNGFQQGEALESSEVPELRLAHLHGADWRTWIAAYRYRVEHGSYRAELAPNHKGGLNMHDLLRSIEAEGGEDALRAFHTEMAVATPELRQRLTEAGLLRQHDLRLDAKMHQIFPDFQADTPSV